jgi:hypothetical protein
MCRCVVVVEDIIPIARDVDVEEAVVVVIAGGRPLRVAFDSSSGEPGGLGHIRERAITVVLAETIEAGWVGSHVLRGRGPIQEKEVDEPIVVIVERGHGASQRLKGVFHFRGEVDLPEIDLRSRGDVR